VLRASRRGTAETPGSVGLMLNELTAAFASSRQRAM
jgi:hypothetical protein